MQIAGILEWTKDSNNVKGKYTANQALDVTEEGYKYGSVDHSGAAWVQQAPQWGQGQSPSHKIMFSNWSPGNVPGGNDFGSFLLNQSILLN